MKRMLVILLAFFYVNLFAQFEQIERYNFQDSSSAVKQAFVIEIDSTTLLAAWSEGKDLFTATSNNNGISWGNVNRISANLGQINQSPDINLLKLNSGRILLVYREVYHYLRYSDDNGISWSDSIQLHNTRNMNNSSLVQTAENEIWLLTSKYIVSTGTIFMNISYFLKSEDGINWTENLDTLVITENKHGFPNLYVIDDSTLGLIYQEEIDSVFNIYMMKSNDNGNTWDDKQLVYESELGIFRPRLIRKDSTTLVLVFQELKITATENYKQYDIFAIESTDNGESWDTPQRFTNFIGFDGVQNVSAVGNEIFISFASNRGFLGAELENIIEYDYGNVNLWYGILGKSEEAYTPPVFLDNWFEYEYNYPKTNVNVIAKVYDETAISSVMVNYSLNHEGNQVLELYDDGQHNDEEAGDMIFANRIDSIMIRDTLFYSFVITDNQLTSVTTEEKSQIPFYPEYGTTYLIDVNNIKLPLDNKGNLGSPTVPSSTGQPINEARFEEAGFLWSGGFALSGNVNGEIWVNGMLESTNMQHYLPGNVSGTDSSKFIIYSVKATDEPFGESWKKWEDAVKLGARFYDGDGDGIYNPVDKNGNGQWDPNEDRPDLLGDQTAWCVFNDAVPADERQNDWYVFNDVDPLGIEIKQTIFGFLPESYPELANVVFIRYNIEYKGDDADKLDSVYFSVFNDPDLGDYVDDLTGTDTMLNSVFLYNEGPDNDYGNNVPAFFTTFLQGPPVFIPGKTFIDNDGNNIFDSGIDTPLDSAEIMSGLLLGKSFVPGAMNQKLTSGKGYRCGETPRNTLSFRYNMLGKNDEGEYIDPCNWDFGQVFNMNCEDVNPLYMYSGDPVTQNGWLNTVTCDQRLMGTTGPFTLEKNKPVEIIVGYIVGRGDDALNSVTVTRNIVENAQGFYSTNFQYVPVGIKQLTEETLPSKFALEQNYPNPFNPATTIKYSIPQAGVGSALTVQLKVYDVLGREVATLVNGKQKPGNYEVTFNARNLSSGVYFYQLKAGDFIATKKLVLLK